MKALTPILIALSIFPALVTPNAFAEGIKGQPLPEHHKGGKAKKGDPLTAATILSDMRAATAFIAEHAKKDMNPKAKLERPFWSGLKLIIESLNKIEKGLKTRDAAYLAGLDGLSRGTAQVATAWAVLRQNEQKSVIGRGVIALDKSYRTFITHFGPQVARMKQGGKISDKETAEIAKQKATVAKFKTQLAKMQSKAKEKSVEARLVADLQHQCAKISDLKVANLSALAQFIYFIDQLEASLYAYSDVVEVWYPEFWIEWKGCDSYYTSFHTASWATNVNYYATWDFTAETVTHYGDYYEEMVSESSTEITQASSYLASYEESSATVDVAEEETAVEEEMESSEDSDETIYEEVGQDDADGDGIHNEDDDDDDNDSVADADDDDDDGDGVADEMDDEPDGGETEADDSDDDGVADDVDMDDDNDGTEDSADSDSGDDDGN